MTVNTVTLAFTGASGIQYGVRLLECLVTARREVYLLMSRPAQVVAGLETTLAMPARTAEIETFFTDRCNAEAGQIRVFGQEQWTAPVASGSGVADAMVVCPCTTGTLAAIAAGNCNNLIERAADVCIKERRPCIVMPREMPFSPIHLQNMLTLAQAGVVIMPPNPGFYNKPQSIDELIDFVVARVLDHLGVDHQLMPRWGLSQ